MCPYLFEIGGFQFGTYGLMMALGFLVCGWLFSRELRRRGKAPEIAWEITLGAAIGGVLGARLLAVAETVWDYADRGIALPAWTDLFFSQGGLTWYGGFAGGAVGAILVIWWRKLNLLEMCDATSPLLMLGYGFGRGGCQLSGDGCYGIATDLPWGMAYPEGIVPTVVPVHPTPIYEILYSVAGFSLFWFWLRHRTLPRGALFAIYLMFTGLMRVLVEFIRINERYWPSFEGGFHIERTPYRPGLEHEFHGLSLSQWVGLALFLWGTVWVVWLFRKAGRTADRGPGAEARRGAGAEGRA